MAGTTIPLETLSVELQRLHEAECLQLEVLQGSVVSDHVVRALREARHYIWYPKKSCVMREIRKLDTAGARA